MAKFSVRSRSLLRAALLATSALALAAAPVMARVGVTSATDGDPLGKPPQENERVLRIGIDVQANELVTTSARDRAHLVFLDGTSLTVGPNARLTIDRFVFDPDAKKGDLAITATQGVFRLVGGKISKNNAITVTTPSSTIGIRGGITIFKVTASETQAAFVFGNKLTITAAGQTQTVTRPGYQVTVNAGGAPSAPTAVPKGGLTAEIAVLENGSSKSSSGASGGNADQRAQSSGFSSQNSGQSTTTIPPGTTQPLNNATSNATTNAVSQANTQVQVDTATPASTTTPTVPSGSGFAAGLITTANGTTSTPVLGGPADFQLKPNTSTSTGGVSGSIVIRQADSSVTTLQLGGTPSTGVFNNDKSYAMLTTDDTTRPSTVQVNGRTYAVQDNSFVLSSGFPQQSGAFGSCTCEYLSWGQWGTSITYPVGYRPNQTDSVPTAFYIAGTMTNQVQMPQTGIATYNGSMMGNVWNNGRTHDAIGSYSSSWSFGSRAGSFNASFDGTSYTGSAAAVAGSGGTSFTGSFSGGGKSGSLSGAFFTSPTDLAKYQAGSFAIGANSTIYKATGVFAGQR